MTKKKAVTDIPDIEAIENALVARYFKLRKDIAICNISWGMLDHEADVAIINERGYLTEYEIKRSLADFRKDFEKRRFHSDIFVSRLVYVLPIEIKDKALELIAQNKERLLEYWGHYLENYLDSMRKNPTYWLGYPSPDYFPQPVVFYSPDLKDWLEIGLRSFHHRENTTYLHAEELVKICHLQCIRYWKLRGVTDKTTKI